MSTGPGLGEVQWGFPAPFEASVRPFVEKGTLCNPGNLSGSRAQTRGVALLWVCITRGPSSLAVLR